MQTSEQTQSRSALWQRDFAENPFIAIWEVTRACQLHCLHCRAQAQRHRDPRELTTAEGFRLIEEIAAMDHPLLVFTGGDPLEREDLFDFIRYAKRCGLEVAMTPSATPRVTREALARAQAEGLSRCAFSLDGSNSAIHDRFRGTKGSFDLTVAALENLRDLGLPIQVNTTVSRHNVDDLEHIADLVESFGTTLWSVFFLVPTGRARATDMVDATTVEGIMRWLVEQGQTRSFDVKTTAAPHYRRVVMQSLSGAGAEVGARQSGFLLAHSQGRAPKGVNDGNGFVFISHTGEVFPSGFLPISAGNIRTSALADLYRNSELFRNLRDASLLKGKCGVCEFRHVCGGSRGRAYGLTGDYLESDPACAYVPAGWTGNSAG